MDDEGCLGLALVVLLSMALSSCAPQTKTVRFRVDVTVEHDGQLFSGYSVQEMQPYPGTVMYSLTERYLRVRVRGEAVRIDVPGEPVGFVFMARPGGATYNYGAMITGWCDFHSPRYDGYS